MAYGSEVLLCDPWFSGRVFNEAWGLLEEIDIDAFDLGKVSHNWISHEHPDHLHFPTLRALRERLSGEVTVYYRQQKAQHVRKTVEELGFRFVALAAGECCRLSDSNCRTITHRFPSVGGSKSRWVAHRDYSGPGKSSHRGSQPLLRRHLPFALG